MSQRASRRPASSPAFAPRKRPRQQRAQETVEAILEAARQMFRAHGYAATTNQIAARAGTSIGTLYQYFPNKDVILLELIEQRMSQGLTTLAGTLSHGAAAHRQLGRLLGELITGMLALYRDEADLLRLLLDEAGVLPPMVAFGRDALVGLTLTLEPLLAELAGIPGDRKGSKAYVLVQIVDAMCREYVLNPPAHLREDSFRMEVAAALEAYLAQQGPVRRLWVEAA